MHIFFYVFLGGGLGSLARFSISKLVRSQFPVINPIATFIANLLATIILGMFVYWAQTKLQPSAIWKALIVTGFCGGFSTFSTFSYESFELIRMGNWPFAVLNVLASSILAIFALYLLSKFAS